MRVFLVFLLQFSFSTAVFAGNYSLIDKRNRTEPLEYRIGLCSRNSPGVSWFPTHAFVIFTRTDSSNKVDFMRATGWSPTAGTKLEWNAVFGDFHNEIQTAISQSCIPVLVNSDIWQSALDLTDKVDIVERLAGDVDQLAEAFILYRVTEQDCITFVQNVAKLIGLKVPDRGILRPVDYIPKLATANGAG